jgi:CTP synthase (UTP-ammonia lyase)
VRHRPPLRRPDDDTGRAWSLGRINLTADSLLRRIYESAVSVERTTCNYGLNAVHAHVAREGGLRVAAVDDTSEVRAIERVDHPFFVGTLYQPQLSSTTERPHPLFSAFVEAACGLG